MVPGRTNRGQPGQRWTWDTNDTLHMKMQEADKLTINQQIFSMSHDESSQDLLRNNDDDELNDKTVDTLKTC